MDTTLLQQLALQMSQRELARHFNVSHSTIKHWLKKCQLKTNPIIRFDGSKEYLCKCGETNQDEFANVGYGRKSKSVCKKCHNLHTISRFREYKQQAVDYKGGKCQKCGYSKCLGALEFHHRDQKEKDPEWGKMRNWQFDAIKEELDKCDLLCSNCHREIHWGEGG